MHWFSINSPTSCECETKLVHELIPQKKMELTLSSNRALVLGSEQSTLC